MDPELRNTIGILGCGWLGLPLGKYLHEQGYVVKGSTRTPRKKAELHDRGIHHYTLDLKPEGVVGNWEEFIEGVKVLIIAIPPGLRKNPTANFIGSIAALSKSLEKSEVQRVLFISSTSVYGTSEIRTDSNELTEKSEPNPLTESAKQLLQAEQLLLQNKAFKTTILRPGGLLGEDRHPIFMLSGRTGLKGANQPVNLIHRKEILKIIGLLLSENWPDDYINLVYPHHPNKQNYYTREALLRSLDPPQYTTEKDPQGMKVLPAVLLKYGYSFTYSIES